MKYTRENVGNLYNKPYNFEFFWGHSPSDDGRLTNTCFSQWWICWFKEHGVLFNCAEQYMMYQKAMLFKDNYIASKILDELDPKEIKKFGRKVRNFDEKTWEDNRERIVVNGNRLKFGQNEDLKSYLLKTGSKILVEASPYDDIWGIKLRSSDRRSLKVEQWQGLNLLGFALMEVRDELSN